MFSCRSRRCVVTPAGPPHRRRCRRLGRPAGRDDRFVHVKQPQEQVNVDRKQSSRTDALRLGGGPSTRSSDELSLDPEVIGRGRWRRYARGLGSWLFSRRYARALDELAEEGNHAAGPLQASYARLG